MKMTEKGEGLGLEAVLESIKTDKDSYSAIGVFEGSMPSNRKKEGLTIAQYAAVNEYGLPEKSIPPRPAFQIAFFKNRQRIEGMMLSKYGDVMLGKESVPGALSEIAIFYQKILRKQIVDLRTPENRPRTIAIKKSSNPLVSTGAYVRAIQWEIRK